MGLIQTLDIVWVALLAASFVYMVLAATRARRALEGLATAERGKALVGWPTSALTGGQRSTLRRCRVALICFLLLLAIPPLLLRSALQDHLADARRSPKAAPAAGGRTSGFATGRLRPVELGAGVFGVRVEHVAESGVLHEGGVRSGETIVAIDGDEFASLAEAATGIVSIGAGQFTRLRIRGESGKERTVAR